MQAFTFLDFGHNNLERTSLILLHIHRISTFSNPSKLNLTQQTLLLYPKPQFISRFLKTAMEHYFQL